jgi:hypothetical protein
MWQSMRSKATRVADLLAETHETRLQWEALTEPTRRMAKAADLELRRRHPGHLLERLKSAEPDGIVRPAPENPPGKDVWIQGTLDGSEHLPSAPARDAAGQDHSPTQPQRKSGPSWPTASPR